MSALTILKQSFAYMARSEGSQIEVRVAQMGFYLKSVVQLVKDSPALAQDAMNFLKSTDIENLIDLACGQDQNAEEHKENLQMILTDTISAFDQV